MNRKLRLAAIAVSAAALTATGAIAADLDNGSGQSCGAFEGTWHFVNNQTRGAGPGTLTAIFSSGTCTTGPSKVNNNNQHFYCMASGDLIWASTNLPGRLVLSDFECDDKKDPDPDPK